MRRASRVPEKAHRAEAAKHILCTRGECTAQSERSGESPRTAGGWLTSGAQARERNSPGPDGSRTVGTGLGAAESRYEGFEGRSPVAAKSW